MISAFVAASRAKCWLRGAASNARGARAPQLRSAG